MKKMRYEWIKGGVTAPSGFSAAGIRAGIKQGKKGKKDMALIVANSPSVAAGVFTVNSVKAAPVILCRRHLQKSKSARAIIINSGNANACTGRQGLADAKSMAVTTGAMLKIDPALVLVCSTGTIGLPLPMPKIECGIRRAVKNLSRTGGNEAARAIMTTDTIPKQAAVRLRLGGKKVTIGAMAKGAGMIAPNMATLLVFITTDIAVECSALQEALSSAVENSFNRILVDGDQSTNDTVLCLANGMAGNKTITNARPEAYSADLPTPAIAGFAKAGVASATKAGWAIFKSALTAVCRKLAYKIVKDGEGVTKVVKIVVKGGKNQSDAEKAARSIARSLLVKTSWFGADPNWGRVICAVGYSGAEIVPDKISIHYNAQAAVINGISADLSPDKLHKIISGKEFTIEVNLRQGRASYSILTCDCSLEYVRINADYMT